MEGSIVYSEHKDDQPPILSRSEAESAVFRAAIRMGTRKEFLDKLGGINYAFTEYGRVNQYTIPLDREVKTLLFVIEQRNHSSGRHNFNGVSEPTLMRIMGILKKYEGLKS